MSATESGTGSPFFPGSATWSEFGSEITRSRRASGFGAGPDARLSVLGYACHSVTV